MSFSDEDAQRVATAVLTLHWNQLDPDQKSGTTRNALNALRKLRNRYDLPAGDDEYATVYTKDDTTPAYREAVVVDSEARPVVSTRPVQP